MLKHKCPKCGCEMGYKWNTSLYAKGYQCPKCKTKLETTFYVTIALFFTFLIGLTLTDNIVTHISFYNKYPQVTKVAVTFIAIMAVWMIVSSIMPRMLKIKVNKK